MELMNHKKEQLKERKMHLQGKWKQTNVKNTCFKFMRDNSYAGRVFMKLPVINITINILLLGYTLE